MTKKDWRHSWVALGLTLPLVLTGCAVNELGLPADDSGLSGRFFGAGASSQEAAQAAWIAEFQSDHSATTINYNPVGSGAGRKQFAEGAVAFAGSDTYLSEAELADTFQACAPGSSALSLPVYVSPIAVAFNLGDLESLQLDAVTLAKIFRGEINRWDDPEIIGLNPSVDMPNQPITVVHRSDDSGTTKNFAAYLQANAPTVWEEEVTDKFPYSFLGAEGAQGTSGVVAAISAGSGTIGYADASKVSGLATVALQVGDQFVPYSAQGAALAVASSPLAANRPPRDGAIDLDLTSTEAGAYPLLLVSYLVVCGEYKDAETADFIKSYVSYVVSSQGQEQSARHAGSAPLPTETVEMIRSSLESVS